MSRRSSPRYSRHSSGQARVRIDGKVQYLGPYGSAESHEEYGRLLAEWQAGQTAAPRKLTVRALTLLYVRHAKLHYRKHGRLTSELQIVRGVLKRLNGLQGRTLAGDFSPRLLKAVRQTMIDRGLARSTINGAMARIRRLFRWAVSEELVRPEVLVALKAVPDLQRGRSAAREPAPVAPVAEADVNAVLPHVSRPVRDMIRLQLLCGCRPDEIVSLRPCDVDRSGEIWEYVPASHKTEHHGKERRVYIGPRAQAILSPYLDDRAAETPCFSPIEADAERRAQQRAERKTPVQPSQVNRRKAAPRRKPQSAYTVASYRRAIARGCQLAGVASWAPNRLRHSRATDLRRRFGLEAAKTVCGHSSLQTTLVYAETDFARARAIMAEVG